MSIQSSVQRIVEHLKEVGFVSVQMPLEIASLRFDFPAVLVGRENDSDLIVVADTVEESGQRIQQKIEGIARALDVLGSRRSITVILAGPKLQTAFLDKMSRVCRILPVGSVIDDEAEESLKNWLLVLTPLSVNDISDEATDPLTKLLSKLNLSESDGFVNELLDASHQGVHEVNEILRLQLLTTLEPALQGIK